MDSVELLLHPVRLRIVQAFLGDRTLTTSELSAELDDVSPGSLYRHVARLADAGVLEIVAEQRKRGTVERTYRLQLEMTRIDPEQVAAMNIADHRRAFMAYVAGLLADFDNYLARDTLDIVHDGVGYRLAALWLDDTEFAEMGAELRAAIIKRSANTATPGRKRRLVRIIHLPADPA
ncbi:helix-turn-helix domain-containing protein [Nocardia sp. NPDC020380]|uniref:helix-turn-helix domain-containing protein n=1 Tax=Nocardia sp. NPDC020380 TaxID=3364309 RepID=UPI0037AFBA90